MQSLKDSPNRSAFTTKKLLINLGENKERVHQILGTPEQEFALVEKYWSQGLEVFYNRHDDKIVDGLLFKKQPSGVGYDGKIMGIKLGDSCEKAISLLGQPINWGLPSSHTSYAVYKKNSSYLTLAIWREKPDLEVSDYKIGSVYAIGYCTENSVLACEPIVVVTIEEIRLHKKLTYVEEGKLVNSDIDFNSSFFKETYKMIPPYPFMGGGFMISVIFMESNRIIDFWLYDLQWSTYVIRAIHARKNENNVAL